MLMRVEVFLWLVNQKKNAAPDKPKQHGMISLMY